MKKTLLLLFFIGFCVTSLVAQRYYMEPEYTLGARAGATASFVSFSPSVPTEMLYGAQAGVAFRYISDRYFGVQVEANFTQRGWQDKSADYHYAHRLNYIEIPFMSHVYFEKNFFRWFFNLGPSISFRISDNVTTDIPDGKREPRHKDEFKSIFDYAITAGTGFEFQTKKAGIYQLEARYSFGFGDLFPNSSSDAYRRSSNQNISLCLGILFNIGKRY